MKILLTTLFSLTISLSFSQTKDQLIDSIIKVNRVKSYCVGTDCNISIQSKRFETLKKRLSDKELIKLSKHQNPTIRTYTIIELIDSGKGNIPEIFSNELLKNEMVDFETSVYRTIKPLSSIVYYNYLQKISLDELLKTQGIYSKKYDAAIQKKLSNDQTLKKLDSIIIYSGKENYYQLYLAAFAHRKHKDEYLPRIENLAFNNNNACAFNYLKENYATTYAKKIENYIKNDYPKAKFLSSNEIFHLSFFTKILLESDDERFKLIAIDKLKNDDIWKKEEKIFNRLLKKNGITL
ncbi:hypothetical protein G1J88_11700 [Tenacibaculum dicentrarchi]|uniref:hypothetical protein n=1 Tax=Tenacibaculum finnmarkense TaxID=2781243 RepID=UPI00187B5660|nr:hypothetical protein [Tenacibaculum finnmarkense]MCD8416064.1 hypothetical protein [Tenacibaculum dicentrarchi]MBE7693693.1 hypothetical protein [Tenacibaculum finnmarkense genomovar finnmarkense]MCD8421179.1 hypothetical protein [Tenacibaculum dicentrarchi]MCD8448044.1 hypothetical protein [Tenacibaculum finnmarkense genomovar finnmarkense]MCG8829044.1 hypothetical protein [Tenacibaculum dicentrarchi]